MNKVRNMFLFLCCLIVAVGPLNFMQMVAWGNMLHDYSGERSITEAADMTFSGEYPCKMCRMIAEARSQPQDDNQPAPSPTEDRITLRLDLHCQEDSTKASLSWRSGTFPPSGTATFLVPLSRFERVPTPPPRAAFC